MIKGMELVENQWGKFYIYPNDLIGMTFKGGNLWDWPFLQEPFEKYSDPYKIAIDVGANMGLHSVWLAQHNKHVISIEPITPYIVSLNCILNNVQDKVTIWPCAGYGEHGFMELNPDAIQGQKVDIYKLAEMGNIGGISLAYGPGNYIAMPLDEIVPQYGGHVGLIKIDAQGCDLGVIEGLQRVIIRDKPAIVFEYEQDLSNVHNVSWGLYVDVLEDFGYTIQPTQNPANFLALPR